MKNSRCVISLMLILCCLHGQAQVVTTGTGVGAIPDNDLNGITVTFPVTGLTAPVESVSVKIQIEHTWVGDLIVRLHAPDDRSSIVIFAKTGNKLSGNDGANTDLNGLYEFNDLSVNDWWVAASVVPDFIPSLDFRSSTAGGNHPVIGDVSDVGGCTTRMDGAFKGLSADQANGDWTLSVVDDFAADTGFVYFAELTINEQPQNDLIYKTSFDGVEYVEFTTLTASSVLGDCKKSRFDYSGNGLADYVFTEDSGGQWLWTIQENDSTSSGAIDSFLFGNPLTDFVLDGDMDGDGINDPVLWRTGPTGQAAFLVRRSSQPNNDFLKVVLGQTGDNPAQIGDYDGDGIDDFALFRAPTTTGTTQLIIHESSTGTVREIDLVSGTSATVTSTSGDDYTGDGIADVMIHRESSGNPGAGEHIIFSGETGNFVVNYLFGQDVAKSVPGNFLGDDRADNTAVRIQVGDREWYSRETGTGAQVGPTIWGTSTHYLLCGDYDGDGYDDYAIYDNSVGEYKFKIIPSANPSTPIEVTAGYPGIYPVANGRVH